MKKLLFTLLFSVPLLAEALSHSASDRVARLYSQNGDYRTQKSKTQSSLAATNIALRAFRYSGIELKDTSAQWAFLESCYRPELAAFIEMGSEAPSMLANAHALMLMGELRHPEDVLAISARDYLIEHAKTADEIYMAMAGMGSMGLTHEVPASWLKMMMDLAVSEDATVSDYQKARAIITCMRAGFNLPDYALFRAAMENGLTASAPACAGATLTSRSIAPSLYSRTMLIASATLPTLTT